MLKVMFEAGSKGNYTYFSPFSLKIYYSQGGDRETKGIQKSKFQTPYSLLPNTQFPLQ